MYTQRIIELTKKQNNGTITTKEAEELRKLLYKVLKGGKNDV